MFLTSSKENPLLSFLEEDSLATLLEFLEIISRTFISPSFPFFNLFLSPVVFGLLARLTDFDLVAVVFLELVAFLDSGLAVGILVFFEEIVLVFFVAGFFFAVIDNSLIIKFYLEEEDKKNKVKIENLGKKLNQALAGKLQELSEYQSIFFKKIKEALGDRKDIKVEGDRFIFPSEIFFESGSDIIQAEGIKKLSDIAKSLNEISEKIPSKIDWVLRIDGHTDKIPIYNEKFNSNWHLSSSRAINIVKLLISYVFNLNSFTFNSSYLLDGRTSLFTENICLPLRCQSCVTKRSF
mgnify:CR=1 FL=1